jgi:hypothetical protein
LIQKTEKLRDYKSEADNLSQIKDSWEMESEIDGYYLGNVKLKPEQHIALTQTFPMETFADGNITFTISRKSGDYSLMAELYIFEDRGNSSDGFNVFQNLPKSYSLNQNYPNPFRGKTTIQYQLPQDSQVSLKIYNIVGQLVKTLTDKDQDAGNYSVRWNGTDKNGIKVSSGVYFYRFVAQDLKISSLKYISTRKIVYLK